MFDWNFLVSSEFTLGNDCVKHALRKLGQEVIEYLNFKRGQYKSQNY